MLRAFVICFLTVAAFFASVASADEAAVRQGFQTKFPNTTVETVSKTPFPGIYEVI